MIKRNIIYDVYSGQISNPYQMQTYPHLIELKPTQIYSNQISIFNPLKKVRAILVNLQVIKRVKLISEYYISYKIHGIIMKYQYSGIGGYDIIKLLVQQHYKNQSIIFINSHLILGADNILLKESLYNLKHLGSRFKYRLDHT